MTHNVSHKFRLLKLHLHKIILSYVRSVALSFATKFCNELTFVYCVRVESYH